jgi:predicted nucleic acid-binding protein
VTLVVSDASPLRYLVVLDHQELLPQLFETIIVPPVVAEELAHPHSPSLVRDWILHPPPWLKIDPRPVPPGPPTLDPGEAQAISLALQLQADVILIDERHARAEAIRLGLRPLGVVGIFKQAADRGLVDFRAEVARLLSTTNFRIAPSVLAALFQRSPDRSPRDPERSP